MLMEALQGGGKGRGQTATVRSLPVPMNGWSTRDKYAKAYGTGTLKTCAYTINYMWSDGKVTIRPGYKEWTTGLPGVVNSLMEYAAVGGTKKIFGAVEDEIYDVSASGAVGAAVVTGLASTTTSQFWQHTMFSNNAGLYLVLANGVDSVREYDGTTWTTPSITGVTSSTLINVATHKGRLWFTQKDTLAAWYLAPFAITGAASKFDLAPFCPKGGYLMAIASWSTDGGNGPDNYIVFVTSEGEVVVYAGLDPNSVDEWSLVGVYAVSKPVGRRCFAKYGADMVLYTASGPVLLSETLSSVDGVDQTADPIRSAFVAARALASTASGWEIHLSKKRGWLWCNVPLNLSGQYEQYIYSPHMAAWFRFGDLNARCWVDTNDVMIFGGDGSTYKWDDGDLDDNGGSITADIAFGWWNFGNNFNKLFSLMRVHFITSGSVTPLVEMRTNFDERAATAQSEPTSAPEGTTWDDGDWDTSDWGGSAVPIAEWLTAEGEGIVASPRVEVSALNADLSIVGIDVAFIPGGIL